jgi:peptide/nickel transport system permease protein
MRRRAKIVTAVVFLAGLHLVVLLGAQLAPYPYAEQHREYPYAPPARLHFTAADGEWLLWPVVYTLIPDLSGGYHEDLSRPHALFSGQAAGVFLLGTDGYGRDVLSRLLYGGEISLFTGLLAALLSLTLGAAAGTVAGYFGGWPDRLLMRGGELVMALPWLYLLLAVRAFLPLHVSTVAAFILLIVIIGGVGWVRPARLIRGVALSARERAFVQASRGFGASHGYLIRRHILPLTAGVIVTQATVLIPQYILAEVTLSFLGLGIGEPTPSWGNMLIEARQYHAVVSHVWLLAPGLAVIPFLLGYLLLADALLEPSISNA